MRVVGLKFTVLVLLALALLGNVAQGARKSVRGEDDDDEFNEFDNFDEEKAAAAGKVPAASKSQETLKQTTQSGGQGGKRDQDDFAGFDDEEVSEAEEEEVPVAAKAKVKPAQDQQKQQQKKAPAFQASNQDDLDAEEFEHFVDDEEFETFDSSEIKDSDAADKKQKPKPAKASSSSGKEQKNSNNAMPSLKIADVPKHLMTNGNWQNYIYEIVMLVLIVAYFVNYLIGKSKNQRLATAWYSSHKELLERQFALVGDNGTSTELPAGSTVTAPSEDGEEKRGELGGSDQLIKESDNLYGLWCSGRQACDGMLVQMKFIKRQDLINGVLMQFVKPQSDQIVFSVEYPSHEDIDSFVFCLTTKKQSSQLHNNYQDLATYCIEKKAANSGGGGDSSSIPSKYVVLNECSEVPSLVVDSRVSAFLRSYPDMVEYLHISDQYIGYKTQNADEQGNSATASASADDTSSGSQVSGLPKSRCMLILCLNVNGKGFNTSVEDMENMQPALQLITYLIDRVPRLRLSKDAKTKALKKRKEVSEQLLKLTHKQRQEEAMLRKEEKRRAEKEKIMNESDPEKQKRLEEKDQKREKKKNLSKMKQIKIKSM